jgi:putative folate metabolism gamma-glutamate ligase
MFLGPGRTIRGAALSLFWRRDILRRTHMKISAIKTAVLHPPQDDLLRAIAQAIPKRPRVIKEKSIIVITSKVVSIWQGRCVSADSSADARHAKDALVMREADRYLPREATPGAWCMHTIKNNVFIPSAGVDESNADDYYILWPDDVAHTARTLWAWLRRRYGVRELGVIITDSHTVPLRRGVLGISLAHYGFEPLRDYRGKGDLFGRPLKMTQTNIPDSLAAAAVVLMGEGAERTPLALVTDVPWVQFGVPRRGRQTKPFSSFEIRANEDLYYPLLSSMKWKKGKGGSDVARA